MGLFSALVKTTIEAAKLPVAAAIDVATMGVLKAADDEFAAEKQLRNLKKASEDTRDDPESWIDL